jgi:hypothetical protein
MTTDPEDNLSEEERRVGELAVNIIRHYHGDAHHDISLDNTSQFPYRAIRIQNMDTMLNYNLEDFLEDPKAYIKGQAHAHAIYRERLETWVMRQYESLHTRPQSPQTDEHSTPTEGSVGQYMQLCIDRLQMTLRAWSHGQSPKKQITQYFDKTNDYVKTCQAITEDLRKGVRFVAALLEVGIPSDQPENLSLATQWWKDAQELRFLYSRCILHQQKELQDARERYDYLYSHEKKLGDRSFLSSTHN